MALAEMEIRRRWAVMNPKEFVKIWNEFSDYINNSIYHNKEVAKMEEFTQINPGVWKPTTAGEEIVGVLVSVQDSTKYENNKIYHIDAIEANGSRSQKVVFGTTVLDDRMSYIKVGDTVKIIFKGTVQNAKKQDTKIFEVYKGKSTSFIGTTKL